MENISIKVLKKKPMVNDLRNGEICVFYDKDRPVFIYKEKNKLWQSSFFGLDEIDLLRNPKIKEVLKFFVNAFNSNIKEGNGIGIEEDGEGSYRLITDYIFVRKKLTSKDDELAQLNCLNGTVYLSDSNTIQEIERT